MSDAAKSDGQPDAVDPKKKKKPQRLQRRLDSAVIRAFQKLEMVAVGALYLNGLLGFLLVAFSAYCFLVAHFGFPPVPTWGHTSPGSADGSHPNSHDPLHTSISGLEFLFLAPLSYLVLRSLAEYIEDLREKDKKFDKDYQDKRREFEALIREASAEEEKASSDMVSMRQEEEELSFLPIGKECLLETKGLTVGLLFAIVATHMFGRLIETRDSVEGKGLGVAEAVVGLCLLGILAAIYFGIELLTASLKARDHDRIARAAKPRDNTTT